MPSTVLDFVERLDVTIQSKYPVPEIGPLLEQTVLAGGKRLRPTLCYLMGGIFGIGLEEITPFARVAEFVHSASLAHDDVLDMAELRRNKPTINAKSTNSQAVLSGDFLVSRVIRELSEINAVELLRDLSEVMEHLVYGEWMQEGSRYDTSVAAERLTSIAEFKTASLLGWCCVVPPRLKRMNEKTVQLCRELGISLGIGFQLVDDVIDYDADGEKDYARDLKNGFVNFVTWELIRANPELVSEITGFLKGEAVPSKDWRKAEVAQAMDRVRKRAADELRSAQQKLHTLLTDVLETSPENNFYATSLLELIEIMGVRSF
jgi:all-trans-nonaprenyl-diphosphate synthase